MQSCSEFETFRYQQRVRQLQMSLLYVIFQRQLWMLATGFIVKGTEQSEIKHFIVACRYKIIFNLMCSLSFCYIIAL